MLASIDWLKKYVDINVTPEELAEKLTRVGLEVESVNYLGAGLEGVVTGKVTQIERHPNSDHLWICMMDYGSGEIVQNSDWCAKCPSRRYRTGCSCWVATSQWDEA
ncbi:MAG: hypothetical protein ACLR2G_06415 [Phascolarctobacterium faecium]